MSPPRAITSWKEILELARSPLKRADLADMLVREHLPAVENCVVLLDSFPFDEDASHWWAELRRLRNHIKTRQLMRTLLELPLTAALDEIEEAFAAACSKVAATKEAGDNHLKSIVECIDDANLIANLAICATPHIVFRPEGYESYLEELARIRDRFRRAPPQFLWPPYVATGFLGDDENEQCRLKYEQEGRRFAKTYFAWLRDCGINPVEIPDPQRDEVAGGAFDEHPQAPYRREWFALRQLRPSYTHTRRHEL